MDIQYNDADIYDVTARDNSVHTLRAYYDNLIPPLFGSAFPENFRLAPADWHLPTEIISRKPIPIGARYIRPISTLDVEFLSNGIIALARNGSINLAHRYPCGMKCPGCFSDDPTYQDASRLMTWEKVFDVIDEARRIGLHSIKFLGPGELFQNPDLFKILDAAAIRKLPFSIFTKGSELGDDELANYVFGKMGIYTALDLVRQVSSYTNVRILLGFNSFDPRRQDRMVGSQGVTGHYQIQNGTFQKRGVERYAAKRNRALVNLVAAGFNDTSAGQRMSLIAAPVGLDQLEEIPEMYDWAARRNIPLVIAPTMESGPKAVGLMKFNKKRDPNHDKLADMYVAVYSRAIENGYINLAELKSDGLSAYMGTAPCNQVANGLYLRLNGKIQMCPGASRGTAVLGDIYERSITEIWAESSNYRLGPLKNNWCVAKQNGMPASLADQILGILVNRFSSPTPHPRPAPARRRRLSAPAPPA